MKEKEEPDFESAMKRLEEVATELEKGDLNLDESMKKFEEGMHLSKKCNEMLEKAEKKISILIEQEGELTEEKFTQNEE